MLLCFQAVITLILATDMARHGEILDSFKHKVDNFDFTNEEHVTCVRIHYVSTYGAICSAVRTRFEHEKAFVTGVRPVLRYY